MTIAAESAKSMTDSQLRDALVATFVQHGVLAHAERDSLLAMPLDAVLDRCLAVEAEAIPAAMRNSYAALIEPATDRVVARTRHAKAMAALTADSSNAPAAATAGKRWEDLTNLERHELGANDPEAFKAMVLDYQQRTGENLGMRDW